MPALEEWFEKQDKKKPKKTTRLEIAEKTCKALRYLITNPVSQQTSSDWSEFIDTKIPVLCRFWEEDGVWNGAAHDLPVAVFGKTLQQAQKHLGDALEAHFEALHELGRVKHGPVYYPTKEKKTKDI